MKSLLHRSGSKRHHGFTLIEVMIVVAIIGIISTIALPSYNEYVARSRRLEAQGALLEAAQFMERFFTVNARYNLDVNNTNVALPAGLTVSPLGGRQVAYNIGLQTGGPRPLAANQYTLQAVPANAQANDRCGTLTFDDRGARLVASLPAGSTATAADCWRR